MDKGVLLKVLVSVAGAAMLAISTTYTANPTAKAMAYVAAICGAVGMYLVGLFQDKPTK